MIKQWEQFGNGAFDRRVMNLRASLNTRSVITLSRFTMEQMKNPAAVTLHFDRAHSLIGLQPANLHLTDTFPVRRSQKDGYGRVFASPFCRFFRIRPESTVVFNNIEIDDDGILVLDLRQVSEIRRNVKNKAGEVRG